MKYIISLFIFVVIVSCKSQNDDNFFKTYSLRTQEIFSTDSICFEEDYFDSHFPELGTIQTPKTHFDVKYDTASRYVVILKGNIKFKKNKYKYETKDMKSISLIHMSIWKLSNQRMQWEFTKNSIISLNNCPIPRNYLSIIKKDFIFANGNRVINVKKIDNKCNSLPITRTYKLY